MELAVGGPGDLPFPGNPASVVLPLHVQVLRHKFALSLPRPDPSCRGQRRPLKGFRLKGFWGAGGGGDPQLPCSAGSRRPRCCYWSTAGRKALGSSPVPPEGSGTRTLVLLALARRRAAGGLGGGREMLRDDAGCGPGRGAAALPPEPPAPCGSAEEPRSPGGVRVSDPPVLARSRTRESRRCPAVRLPPGGGEHGVGGTRGGSLGKRPGRAGDAGGLRLEAARKRRCEGAMALLLLRYKTEAGAV